MADTPADQLGRLDYIWDDEEIQRVRMYLVTVLNPAILEFHIASPAQFPATLLRHAVDEIERLQEELVSAVEKIARLELYIDDLHDEVGGYVVVEEPPNGDPETDA